jgi:hypothetical protein
MTASARGSSGGQDDLAKQRANLRDIGGADGSGWQGMHAP